MNKFCAPKKVPIFLIFKLICIKKYMQNIFTPLKETTNEEVSSKRSKSESKSESTSLSKSVEETEREIIIEFLKDKFYTTKSNKLKFELTEILKYLRGEEIAEVKELKKIVDELLIENENLLETKVTDVLNEKEELNEKE